jgi:hypothetical protein
MVCLLRARPHPDLPSSRATPLKTCPDLRPRLWRGIAKSDVCWWLARSPWRIQVYCLPTHWNASAFAPTMRRLSLRTTTIHFSGLTTQACGTSRFIGAISLHPASDSQRFGFGWARPLAWLCAFDNITTKLQLC